MSICLRSASFVFGEANMTSNVTNGDVLGFSTTTSGECWSGLDWQKAWDGAVGETCAWLAYKASPGLVGLGFRKLGFNRE